MHPFATPSRRKLHIAMRSGRLANRLVIFANLVALAMEYGCELDNLTFHRYAAHFKNLRRNFYCRYPVPHRPSLWDVISPVGWFLRYTRLPYHVVRYLSLLNERYEPFGKFAVTLRAEHGLDQLESTAMKARL